MIAFIGLLGLADVGLGAAALHVGVSPGLALIGHLLLSCCAILSWWRSGRARRFSPVLAMALGPIGVLIGMVAPAVGAWTYRFRLGDRHDSVEKGPIAQPRRPSQTPGAMVARLLDGRVRHPDPDSLGSLMGVLRHGNIDERRGALEATVRNFDPRLSSIVAKALTDHDQTIRALAAAAASRIAQKLAEERLAFMDAATVGDRTILDRLGPILWDHSQFDLLLSATQRNQIARDVIGVADSAAPDARNDIAIERHMIIALNDSWAKQDFAAVDRICGAAAQDAVLKDAPLQSAARWWAQQSC